MTIYINEKDTFKPFKIKKLLTKEMIDYYDSSFRDVFSSVESPIIVDEERGLASTYKNPSYIRRKDTETIRKKIEERFKSSLFYTYAYHAEYYHNSWLNIHADNDWCEVSCTMNIYTDIPWPIKFFYKKEVMEITCEPGDGVIYSGPNILHWREPYAGEHYNQLMFHYTNDSEFSKKIDPCSYINKIAVQNE